MSARRPWPVALLLGAILALPAEAAAETLYAAPDGSRSSCTAIAPCALEKAVENVAVADDVVVVHQGAYNLGEEQLRVPFAVTVRGRVGRAKPVITSSCCPNPGVASTAVIVGQEGVIRNLEIRHPGGGAGAGVALSMEPTNGDAATAGGIVAVGEFVGCAVAPGSVPDHAAPLLHDSVCISTTDGGIALNSALFPGADNKRADIRGVTALALGGSGIGMQVRANGTGAGSLTADVRNSIVSGNPTDVLTVVPETSSASATLSHSNYDVVDSSQGGTITAAGSGDNQTDLPLLANPAAFEFRQLPGSPTIDAGSDADAIGPSDAENDLRIAGAAVDIGADEYAPRCLGRGVTLIAEPGIPTLGTDGVDVIVGTAGADVIRSRGGRDFVCSRGGDDRIAAGGGRDVIRAGGGDDRADGGGGALDKIFGQAGADRLLGGGGSGDLCHGGGGDDTAANSCERFKSAN